MICHDNAMASPTIRMQRKDNNKEKWLFECRTCVQNLYKYSN